MKYIDNIEFAKKRQTLTGKLDTSGLTRIHEIYEELSGNLEYTISGSADNKNKPILMLTIYGKISTLCQNCLKKLSIPIEYNSTIPIFYTESDMDNALFGDDITYTDGILADVHFDIENFMEDELIMLLPIAPKHKQCKAIVYQDKPDSIFSVLIR